mmetsp:Transcript_20928/g.30161  ORF Transcript_20928/g.30161 Transcript_20928/m.30161 type:complete len:223 (+) Transcript_20928:102-770(+)|eukprot:CAMPEP_0185036606 /NCGR_PEP_ID=MMETSP1103-20130426/29801_1 /TAXON_ID=36769 /ORGANISM="Paraphysomonas bandaiensis, Strain Caron Lab Isolate" /LENGTH=222 /DNA_ID=CAMNT_0027574201 /DNA_START=34 /DNA_END=702 /DNA_ORIENTATION=-
MGSGCSADSHQGGLDIELTPETNEVISKLKLFPEEVDVLWQAFTAIDKEHSRLLNIKEFHNYFKLEETPFSRMVFSKMDGNDSHEISFIEFVINIWDFLTLDLLHFVFKLYDRDGSKTISRDEFENITLGAYGIAYGKNKTLDGMVARADSNVDGNITFEEFELFTRRHQNISYPGHQIQTAMKTRIGGEKFWDNLRESRERNFKDQSVFKILHGFSSKKAK